MTVLQHFLRCNKDTFDQVPLSKCEYQDGGDGGGAGGD